MMAVAASLALAIAEINLILPRLYLRGGRPQGLRRDGASQVRLNRIRHTEKPVARIAPAGYRE